MKKLGISICAYTSQIGPISLQADYHKLNLSTVDSNTVRCPDTQTASLMEKYIKDVRSEGDTVGGTVSCVITGTPAGLGEPVFGKLQAKLSEAMMNINAAKGFEYGMGFAGAALKGSEAIDSFITDEDGNVFTQTNHSGGIQGGISNGEDIYFRVAFKPVATLLRDVETINDRGEKTILRAKGRHDPCVVPRAVPIVDSLAAMVILDAILLNKTSRI